MHSPSSGHRKTALITQSGGTKSRKWGGQNLASGKIITIHLHLLSAKMPFKFPDFPQLFPDQGIEKPP